MTSKGRTRRDIAVVAVIIWCVAKLAFPNKPERVGFSMDGNAYDQAVTHSTVDTNQAPGISLCLSGGGYRAALFELGVLWRLNELGALGHVTRITAVSGGSIIAAAAVLHWRALEFDKFAVSPYFATAIAKPILHLTGKTIDVPAVARSFLSRYSASHFIAAAYDAELFDGMSPTLSSLEKPPAVPALQLDSTELENGSTWRFGQLGIAATSWPTDSSLLGDDLQLPLAVAVAASSAFPPFLSPLTLDVSGGAAMRDRYDPRQVTVYEDYWNGDLSIFRASGSHINLTDGASAIIKGRPAVTARHHQF